MDNLCFCYASAGDDRSFLTVRMEDFFHFVQNFVYWRNPLTLIAITVIIELIFFAIFYMNLDFIPTIFFLLVIFNIARIFRMIFGTMLYNDDTGKGVPDTDHTSCNEQIKELFSHIFEKCRELYDDLLYFIYHPTPKSELYFFTLTIFLMLFSHIVGTLPIIFVFTQLLIIIILYMNPTIHSFICVKNMVKENSTDNCKHAASVDQSKEKTE